MFDRALNTPDVSRGSQREKNLCELSEKKNVIFDLNI